VFSVYDRSPAGMYRSAEDGRIEYANAALARMLGYAVDELRGKILDTHIYADPDHPGFLPGYFSDCYVVSMRRCRRR